MSETVSRTLKDRIFLPAQRRKTLTSESQEHLFSNTTASLSHLGKKPQRVFCPYCKHSGVTRVEQSDSKTTKALHAVLWAGMADPFAISTFNLCQNIDHYCGNCNGHLARKPFRRASQPIPENSIWEGSMLGEGDKRDEAEHVAQLRTILDDDDVPDLPQDEPSINLPHSSPQ